LPSTSPLNSANTITKSVSVTPYPQFTDLWLQEYTGSNRYKALQLQVRQRFSKNLSFTASYTRSKLTEKTTNLNPSDVLLEERVSANDRPDRFTTSVVYLLPFGKSQQFGRNVNKWANAIIGGWQVNGTYEWQSGEPFTLSPTQVWYYAGDV